jgi:hypothetical protein
MGFLVSLVVGLVACASLGRLLSSRDYHQNFTRFHVRISPEAHYYPTIEEMRSIVRARCRPDQILVIVGGNSVFYGVGQPVGKLWTEELQRRLGSQYCVVNFAMRGAICTDGGAVVAETLRDEFPRQIYVANTSPFSTPAPYGVEPYRYLFREALSRGLLEGYEPRQKLWDDYRQHEMSAGERMEQWSSSVLDRAFRFRDLWNWVGYNWFFTIQNPHTPDRPQAYWPRKRFKDEEGDFELTPPTQRFPLAVREAEMAIVRAFSAVPCERDTNGGWRVKESSRQEFVRSAHAAMPEQLRPRTLIVLSRNSPNYLAMLSTDERAREEVAYAGAIAAWKAEGYEATDYGPGFSVADFGDRTHLAASGGVKLAARLAPQVQAMSLRLGYLADDVRPAKR